MASSLSTSVSASIDLPDSGLHRFRRGAAFALGRRDARAEEIFELVEPAVAQQIFVRRDAADGRFVHADRVGDFAQRHRLHRRHAALEEALLPLDDLADRLDDRPRPLVERFDQPARVLQAFAQPGARRLVLRAGLELLIIAAVDQQPRQRRLVELDRISAAGLANEHVGRHVLARPRPRFGSRAWGRRREARGSCRRGPRRRRRRCA